MGRVAVILGIALLWVGCGGKADSRLAATVARVNISEAQVAAWVSAFSPWALSLAPNDTPFDACVRSRAREMAAKGGAPTGGVERGCEAEVRLARAETVAFLIRSVWIEREARRRFISLTPREERSARRARVRELPRHQSVKHYFASAGMTQRQFRSRVRRDALFRKLMMAIGRPNLKVVRADVDRYYRQHPSAFTRSATRDLRVVVTRSRARAASARAQIRAGRAWGKVADEFTIDASRSAGGRTSVDTRNVIRRLRVAVFSAPIGRLVGPIDVRGAWWVFRVDRHRPARRLSLTEAAPRIRASIRSTREQFAADRLLSYLTHRYRPHTACHNGYSALECRNVSRGAGASGG